LDLAGSQIYCDAVVPRALVPIVCHRVGLLLANSEKTPFVVWVCNLCKGFNDVFWAFVVRHGVVVHCWEEVVKKKLVRNVDGSLTHFVTVRTVCVDLFWFVSCLRVSDKLVFYICNKQFLTCRAIHVTRIGFEIRHRPGP
jgi:hypothetical protein